MREPSAVRSRRSAGPRAPGRLPPLKHVVMSPATLVVAFAFAILCVLAPILAFPLPPLTDYPNHLARMRVIMTIGSDPDIARYYEIHWHIIPNLVMDLVVPVFARVTDIYHAGQAFTAVCFVMLATGIFALNAALFRSAPVAGLAALPLLYNRVFLIGLLNYWFGVGLIMWAMAAWIRLRERWWPWRVLVSTLFAIALFFCHLVAVGIYGMTLLAFELWRLRARRTVPLAHRLAELAVTGVPFLPVVALLLASPTWGLAHETQWSLSSKLDGLHFVISTYSDPYDFALAAAIAAILGWAAHRGALRVHPAGVFLLGLGAVAYVATPNVMLSAYLVDVRLPIAIVLIAIAFTTIGVADLRLRYGVSLALLVVLVLRVGEVWWNWQDLSAQMMEVRESTRFIEPRGARVLVAQSANTSDDEALDYGLAHAGCLAIIERSALVTDAFTYAGKQIMSLRPAYRHHAATSDVDLPSLDELLGRITPGKPSRYDPTYWEQWQDNFDYLYVIYTDDDDPKPAPEALTMLYEGDRFRLFKIRKPGQR